MEIAINCSRCEQLVRKNADAVGVTCCNSIFHKGCLTDILCPNCKEMYRISENPIEKYLTKVWARNQTNLDDLYVKIYHSKPSDLIAIDQILRSDPETCYQERYFPYQKFNTLFDIEQFKSQWDIFSYGLLKGYNWTHTSACGRAVWALAKRANPELELESEHIYMIIHNSDYRKVRKQLEHLLNTIEENSGLQKSDVVVYIHESILVVCIRGIVRKFCIYMEYNDTPFLIGSQKYFNTFGSLYDGTSVSMSVKAIANDKAPDSAVLPLSGLDYVIGYDENINGFSKRIGLNISNSTLLLQNVYPDYKFKITERPGIDGLKKTMIKRIIEELNGILDIEHSNDGTASEDVVMELVSTTGTVKIPTTIISPKQIRKQIYELVYLRPLRNT